MLWHLLAQDIQYVGENSSYKVPNKDKVLRIPSYTTLDLSKRLPNSNNTRSKIIPLIPDAVKFQNKCFEIKLTVFKTSYIVVLFLGFLK